MATSNPDAALLAAPDLNFRLTDEQRAQLHPLISAGTFERLLQWMRPEVRRDFLGLPFLPGSQKIALGEIQPHFTHPEVVQILEQLNADIRARSALTARP